ncbi:hypothetical protein [Shewanella ulleungensis]|jgi:hypothetical protein|uniref:hypothetical protein n=1 Tax=Shewanella ulleungensis TaxID=2282699 RepID=UPI003D7B950F|tara:strand:+ start:2108 stop:2455 length:348 start_codon:yes stop_codon:yes gene_type:complete
MKEDQQYTTNEKSSTHDTVMPLLDSMYLEFKEFSKKKPDAVVSKSKILIVNRLIMKVRVVLTDEASLEFLDLLDEDDVPQTSDVTLILSQYVAAMVEFKLRFYGWNGDEHVWFSE